MFQEDTASDNELMTMSHPSADDSMPTVQRPACQSHYHLQELIDVKLAKSEDRWCLAGYRLAAFECQEVLHLVKALFEDIDMRRRVMLSAALEISNFMGLITI